MHSGGGGVHGGAFGGVSEYNPIDDFDLYWGMGPSRSNNNEPQQQSPQVDPVSNGSIALSPAVGSGGSSGKGSTIGVGGSGLSSSSLSMGGGGLWSHGGQEAYGHRHHVHAQDGGIVGGGLASPAGGGPRPISSRRAVWPSPSPSTGTNGNRNDSPLQTQQSFRLNHNSSSSAGTASSSVGTPLTVAAPAVAAGSDVGISSSGSIVDSKLEELAAAISSSVLGKLEVGVAGALLSQQQQQQLVHAPPSIPAASSTNATVETMTAVRSRLAALEEQVAELRRTALDHSLIQNSRLPEDRANTNYGEKEPPSPPLASRGPQRSAGGRNRGGTGGSMSGGAVSTLEQSLAALVQRTGTLEGRHKQVQAKVALLDNVLGPKASDWAQTVRDILADREAAAAAAGGSGAGAGGKTSAFSGRVVKKVGKSSSAHTGGISQSLPQSDDYANARARGVSADSNSSSRSRPGAKEDAGATNRDSGSNSAATTNSSTSSNVPCMNGLAGATKSSAASTKREANPPPTQPTDATRGRREGTTTSASRAGPVLNTNAAADQSLTRRCGTCAVTEERCTQLEARVSESERAMSLLRKQTAEAHAQARAATAASEVGIKKASEAASAADASAAAAGTAAAEAAAMAKADAEAGGRGHHQHKATGSMGSSLEKLAVDLKQLSERMKEGEDALALVEHGLTGVRDEVSVD